MVLSFVAVRDICKFFCHLTFFKLLKSLTLCFDARAHAVFDNHYSSGISSHAYCSYDLVEWMVKCASQISKVVQDNNFFSKSMAITTMYGALLAILTHSLLNG